MASWEDDKYRLSWQVAVAAEMLQAPRNTICPGRGGGGGGGGSLCPVGNAMTINKLIMTF